MIIQPNADGTLSIFAETDIENHFLNRFMPDHGGLTVKSAGRAHLNAKRRPFITLAPTSEIKEEEVEGLLKGEGEPQSERETGDGIFSGDYSQKMWDNINNAETVEELRWALYFVCCQIQELESKLAPQQPDAGQTAGEGDDE